MGRSASSSNSAPWIFLSHSGRQKGGIVTYLYHALLSANHLPFFDQDTIHSLPSGEEYPPRILEACQECKLGVIVLSEDYINSLWPMLELQLLLSDPNRLIYPLFYQLQPVELSNSSNLARWIEYWAEKASKWQSRMLRLQENMSLNGRPELQINLDISSWADNLGKLQYRSGSVRTLYQSDFDYIQAVVANICGQLPPPRKYSFGGDVKGVARMQKVIAEAFEEEGSMGDDAVQAVGMHGIGGSGKSTLCKAMTNFYSKSFLGRSFCLEFPSDDTDMMNVLDPILKSLSCTHGHVSDMNEVLILLRPLK